MEDPAPAIPLEKLVAHREWVRRVARALVRDEALADDLEQEVWLEALRNPPASGRSLRGWLASALRNNLLDRRRAESRRRAREEVVARPESARSTADLVAEADLHRRVVAAVLELDEPYREVLLLRYFEDLPPGEVAFRQGVPLETARSRVKRAIALLREKFDAKSGGDRRAWCLALLPLAGPREAPVAHGPGIGATVAGGAFMTGKTFGAGAVLVALGVAGWFLLRDAEPKGLQPAEPPGIRLLADVDRIEPGTASSPVASLPTESSEMFTSPPPAPVDLATCDRDRDLFGVVVDETGVSVAGARLEVLHDPRRGNPNVRDHPDVAPRVTGSTRSATDGTFRFILHRGAVRDLRVTAAGFAATLLPGCLAGERMRVTLHRGGSLEVLVRDSKRSPVEGALVRLSRTMVGNEEVFEHTGFTDGDGRCVFSHLVPGRVGVIITHSRHAAGSGFSAVPRSGSVVYEVVLPDGVTVYGTVRDGTSGVGIPGARISHPWERGKVFLTDGDGRFAFAGWRNEGSTMLRVDAVGYAWALARVAPDTAADVILSAEDIVEGRVRDASGSALPGAFVTVLGAATPGANGDLRYDLPRVGVTGLDGGFRVRGLRHDIPHLLRVEAEGHGCLFHRFEPAVGAPGTVSVGDLVLPRSAALEGTLLDAGGRTLAGQSIHLEGPLGLFPASAEAVLAVERRTDDRGRFRFHDLAPGRYRVIRRIAPGGNEPGAPAFAQRTLREGEEALGVEVRLEEEGSLAVRVVDESGAVIPGANVSVRPLVGTWIRSIFSDAHGRATFIGLPAGKVQVQGSTFSGMPWSPSVPSEPMEPDGSEVVVALRRKSVVRGRIVDLAGAPLEGVEVRARSLDESLLWVVVSDGKGEFLLEPPQGEVLELEVNGAIWKDRDNPQSRGPSSLRARLSQVPVPSEGVILKVGVPEPRRITVRVLDADEVPVEGVRVVNFSRSPAVSARTGADGRAVFEDLLPEPNSFGILARGLPEGHVAALPLSAVPEGQEIIARLRRGVPIEGTVLRVDGTPAFGAHLSIECADGSETNATTDEKGRFRIHIPPSTEMKRLSAEMLLEDRVVESVELSGIEMMAVPLTLRLAEAR